MNITLNQTDGTNAQLKVVLEEADYAPKVDQQVKEFSKKAQIKGFRPGKVPAGLVKKMYGKSVIFVVYGEIEEVPIIFTDRTEGTSKMSTRIFREAFLGVIQMKVNSWFRNYKK